MIVGESIENKMNQEQNKINCPKCGEEIDVNDILYHQVDEQLKKQNTTMIKQRKGKISSGSQLKAEAEEDSKCRKKPIQKEVEKKSIKTKTA